MPSSIVVSNNDITDLAITVPPVRELTGRVAIEGGSRVPVFGLVFTAASGKVITAVLDGSSDGAFKIALPEGEYRVTTTISSLLVKSLAYGSADLLTESLKLSMGDSSEIRITFATPNP